MKSAVAITGELDDLEKATEELCSGIRKKLQFERSAVGILCCDADVAVDELGRRLHERLGIEIVGLTTMATMERYTGYNNMGIILTVLTGDDLAFSVGVTGEINKDNYIQRIREAYAEASSRLAESLAEDPKLILMFAPYIPDLTSDRGMTEVHAMSGGVPIFGGIATDHYDLQYQKTFRNGVSYDGGYVFLLISGNIRPIFAICHSFDGKVERKSKITKSSDNQIERVDDLTFTEYLATMMPCPKTDEVVALYFQSTPFLVELPDYDPSEPPVVRALCSLDQETGKGGFISQMPEGSTLSLAMLQRNNLLESCTAALDQILAGMAKAGDYTYSMVFVCSCNARHLLLADLKARESEILVEKLAGLNPELNAMGFYGFGELCPTGKDATNKALNRYHNMSFTVCAF